MRLILLFISYLAISGSSKQVDKEIIKAKADAVAIVAQQALVKNLMQAINRGGVAYAVEFCNTNAFPIIDSLSKLNALTIQRVSDQNRNPLNALTTSTDKVVFGLFKQKNSLKDTLQEADGQYTYYKRINIQMPTCLNCHGDLSTDIDKATLAKININYPNDKAMGYKMNDFRGLWKISFSADWANGNKEK